MGRQTKITIETDSLLVLRGCKSLRVWCPECGAQSEMIPLDSVGVISNVAPPEVEAWFQSADLHRVLSVEGASLICLNSIFKCVTK